MTNQTIEQAVEELSKDWLFAGDEPKEDDFGIHKEFKDFLRQALTAEREAGAREAITQDRNQAYTRLVEEIEGRMEEHDGGAYSTQLEKQVHDREVFLYNQTLTDILENVVKPLYNKTGDN